MLAWGVVAIARSTSRPDSIIAAGFLGLGASLGGYALGAALLPSLTRSRVERPALTVGPDDGDVHIILLADAEPDEYHLRDITRTLDLLEDIDVPLPPYLTRPLVYASERTRYHRAGGSPARASIRAIAKALATRPDDEPAIDIRVAFCDGGPDLPDVVAEIAAAGGRRIVIVALSIAMTRALDSAIGGAQDLELSRAGIEIAVTDPLWASGAIASSVARRALSAFGDHGLEDGVVLVSEGNPWQWDRQYPAAAEQSTFFAQRVRAELLEAGLPAERIRQAWLDWEQPDIPEAVRHLAALGAAQIALVPVDFLTQALAVAVDLPFAAERATFETGIHIECVPPLADDPVLIAALRRQIARATLGFEPTDGRRDVSSPGTARD
jgi:protoheme ferro-lyase